MPTKTDHIKALARALGLTKALHILILRAIKRKKSVTIKIGPNELSLRPCDSDLFVLGQIFGSKEYGLDKTIEAKINSISSSYKSEGKIPLIIDAGANVGYSSIYFADTYPDAHVIAIEPDHDTFIIMKQNCSGHTRITPIHAALWKHNDGVNLQNLGVASWARTVNNNGATPSRTLQDIFSTIPESAPLILKMDIEGSEKETVEAAPDVVRSFPVIMIEPHDFEKPGSSCLSPLYSAISNEPFDTLLSGENIIFLNIYRDDANSRQI